MKPIELALEALLFASGEAMNTADLAKVIGEKDRAKVLRALERLAAFYEDSERAFFGKGPAGWQMKTRPDFAELLGQAKRVRKIKLSQGLLETLAVVAYEQPVTRAEVENVRSVDASGALRSLLDKKLVRIAGKKEAPGRPLLYGTTSYFLEIFGLKSLKDLPRPEEFDLLDANRDDIIIEET